MPDASIASTSPTDAPAAEIAQAFRDVHGRRLHGFALLLTLGDRALAARLVADALATAATRTGELRHPERAAAWLRARVLRGMPHRRHVRSPAEERAALDARERAALIAADVELLDPRDVETIAGRHGERLERLLVRARRRYLAYAPAPIGVDADADGTLVRRIRAVAARTMA